MDKQSVALTEYGPGVHIAIGPTGADVLKQEVWKWQKALGLRRPPISILTEPNGKLLLRAEGATGVLSAGSLTLELRPKFLSDSPVSWKAVLWNILGCIGEVPPQVGQLHASETESSMLDQLGWMFIRSLEASKLEGLPRGYVEQEESLTFLRGKLHAARISDTIVRPGFLPCVYETYSHDVPINRLLFWACRVLAEQVNSLTLASLLQSEAFGFSGVGLMPPSLLESESISLPVSYRALEGALDAAKILLRGRSISPADGVFESPSFLWNSAVVFERFAGVLLRRTAHRKGWRLQRGISDLATPVTAKKPVRTNPDFRLESAQRVCLVLDAKYKGRDDDDEQPQVSDVYQLLAGGRLYQCNHAVLIYPSMRERKVLWWKVKESQPPENLFAVHLNLSLMEAGSGQKKLVDQLTTQLEECLTRP